MPRIADKPLAIIGMECRLPGADNLEQFWQLLIEGRSELGTLPRDRFDADLYFHPEKGVKTKSYSDKGGIVPHRPLNQDLAPLPEHLVKESHAVHLNLYEVAVSACRRAGLDPYAINGRTGVYVGHTPPSSLSGSLLYARQISETAQYLRDIPDFVNMAGDKQEEIIQEIIDKVRSQFSPGDPDFEISGNAFHASALITCGLNLDGPSMSFDAACASSLRALGHAARALQLGQIDQAIIGSASYCNSDTLVLFSAAQSVTTNISRPFDNEADGLVASEGYVALVVKTLEKALDDGDNILSVIRSMGISSDGKGKSLWAPRHEGQIEAIHRAYSSDDLQIEDLQYIEMHATSTQVGDATEMKALTTVLKDSLPPGTKLPIGSVKANVGHTLETAGLASLCKTVLAMQHGVIPPQINITQFNEKIDWNGIPFFVPTEPTAWDEPANGRPRRAAVNAFGIGGLNVHVVLDQFSPTYSPTLVAPKVPGASTVPAEANVPIAIVGMGAIYPGAHTADALMESILSGKDNRCEIPKPDHAQYIDVDSEEERNWRNPLKLASLITDFEYDWKKHKVPPKQVTNADPTQFMLLDAADQAFKHAGYDLKEMDRKRIGVIVGSIFGSEFADKLQMGLRLPEFRVQLFELLRQRGLSDEQIESLAKQYQDVLLKRMPALVDETGSFTASTLASRITKTFDLMGGAVAVDGGDASSFSALASCIDLLRVGDSDMMVCACGQREMTCAAYTTLDKKGERANHKPGLPFDKNSEGAVPGEGVGVLLLKRLPDAQRDGDTIHGIIRGVGVSYNPSLKSAVSQAINRGVEAAQINKDQVTIVEALASGIGRKDQPEAEAIADAYQTGTRNQPVYIGAATAQFGHCGGASGVTSIFKSMAELNAAKMAPLAGQSEPLDVLRQSQGQVELSTTSIPLQGNDEEGKLLAGVNSVSQFNMAYHLVLEGVKRVPATPKTADSPSTNIAEAVSTSPTPALPAELLAGPWKIVRIGSTDLGSLAQVVAAKADTASQLFESANQDSFGPSDKARLAVVAESAEDLEKKLTWAAKQINNPKSRGLLAEKGIFCNEIGDQKCRIVFAFPGQGSQYDGMLKKLISEFPPAAATLQMVDTVFQKNGIPTFADLAWNKSDQISSEIWRTQLSLLAANTIMLSAVSAIGLRPDRLCGHSFGELAAYLAAESWSFETALKATIARCSAIDACQDAQGILLSTNAPTDVLEDFCQKVGNGVWISHRNAPDQNVVGGVEESVLQVQAAVEQAGYKSLILDVPAAFHTPLMEGVKTPFAAGLADLTFEPPRVPLISSVTNRYVADPDDLRNNLVVQMTQPVYYADLIERVAAEGPSLFLEVGPRQVLTGLHKRTFQGATTSFVSVDHSKRSGIQQLLFARACAETTGALDPRQDTGAFTAGQKLPEQSNANPGSESQDSVCSQIGELALLKLSGSSYEIGKLHGESQADELKSVLRRYADLVGTKWDRWPQLDEAVKSPEQFFGPEELEELKGIANGTHVDLDAIIAHNLRLYLDAGAGGLHFAVSAGVNPDEGLLHAVNEDLQRGLSVRDCLRRYVMVRHPQNGLSHIAFGVAGQVGCLNGINSEGIAVSTSALLGRDIIVDDSVQRLLPTVLVKRVLENAKTIDDAIQIIQQSHCAVCFSVCLSHHATDRVCYIEYNGKEYLIAPTLPSVMASNHQLMQGATDEKSPVASQHRLHRLQSLLGGNQPQNVTVSQAQSTLRDQFDPKKGDRSAFPTTNTLRRVDNQVSILMQPKQGNLWVTAGPLSNGHQNDFVKLKINDLLSGQIKSSSTGAASTPNDASSSTTGPQSSLITADSVVKSYSEAADLKAVCQRYVMRVVECASPAGTDQQAGPVIVLGNNAVAQAIQNQLAQQGRVAYGLSTENNAEQLIAQLDQVWEQSPAPHLVIATAWDNSAATSLEENSWQQRRNAGALLPYQVCQRWFQQMVASDSFADGRLTMVTAMGGDFGFSGSLESVESGAISGLAKGIDMEIALGRRVSTFQTKIVDFEIDANVEGIASAVLSEMAASDGEMEVGYFDGKRHVARPVVQQLNNTSQPQANIPAGVPFVVTGGARGVTAVVARELGQRFGVKLHLVGSSPLQEVPEAYLSYSEEQLKEVRAAVMKEARDNKQHPIDTWGRYEKAIEVAKSLKSLADMGISATYHACDISNRDSVAQVLNQIRSVDGPIHGVIHGAGFERAASFEKKKIELVDRTIAAKVDGAANLMELTKGDPLQFFMAFGSVSGRFGGVGQTDYCLANEMLAKLIDWYQTQRPECRAAIFHWHAWDDVGMAVRPESKHIAKMHNIRFMPSLEGADHLIHEMTSGLNEREIAITELTFCQQKYGSMVIGSANDSESSPNIDSLPMIDSVREWESGQRAVVETNLDPTADIFLQQHLFKGHPLMPVVVTLETLLEAATVLNVPNKRPVGLKNIEIQNGLRFVNDNSQVGRTYAELLPNGNVDCRFVADFHNRKGKLLLKDKPYLRAEVIMSGDAPQLVSPDPLLQPEQWNPMWYMKEDDVMYHGPIFRYLMETGLNATNPNIFHGRITAPQPDEVAGRRQGNGWQLASSVLDASFFGSGIFLWWKTQGAVAIPAGVDAVYFTRQPRAGEVCDLMIYDRGQEGDTALYDFFVFGDDGEIIMQVDGYRNVIVAEVSMNAQ